MASERTGFRHYVSHACRNERPRGYFFRKFRFVLGGATCAPVSANAGSRCTHTLSIDVARAHAHTTDFANTEGRRVPSSSSSPLTSRRELPIYDVIVTFVYSRFAKYSPFNRKQSSAFSHFPHLPPSVTTRASRHSRKKKGKSRVKSLIYWQTSITSRVFCHCSRPSIGEVRVCYF